MNVVVYCGSNPGNNTNYAKAALNWALGSEIQAIRSCMGEAR